MTTEQLIVAIQNLRFEDTFNPYCDRCDTYDLLDAPERRTATLRMLLSAASRVEVDSLWIGRDLGYRGGRRTGLALTDDVHLSAHAMRWNLSAPRATRGSVVAERTAAVIWSMLAIVPVPIFLWNVFPLHPHEPGRPFTNRPHRRSERRAGEELLVELIDLLRPRRLIAIGNDSARTAHDLAGGADVVQVRHPSYGGQRDFKRQISWLYGLGEIGAQEQADLL